VDPIVSILVPFVVVTLLLGVAWYFTVTSRVSRAEQVQAIAIRDADVERAAREIVDEAERALETARTRAKELLLEAKEDAVRLKADAETDARSRLAEIQRREQRMSTREEVIDRKAEGIEKRERASADALHQAESRLAEVDSLKASHVRELERISALTSDEARAELIARIEATARDEALRTIREMEQHTKLEAARRARWIVAQAIHRCAADTTVELTQTSVTIPTEEMKGRIIGKEGRNIRALEAATGVDFIIDETPETVTLSSFDPLRREVARVALLKLMADGRINPSRIEELVQRATAEVETQLREDGERAAYEAGVSGLHPELFKVLGRLKYRSSYGQNQLQHSLEVSLLAGSMAAEVGADVAACRRAGLLHDIGKALTQTEEAAHAAAGAEFARKVGVPLRVVHAIAAHHFEVEPLTVEAFLVAAADAISASRPGARRESAEHYIRRLHDLEATASSFAGVDRAYALQAGREIRILVRPEEVDDDQIAVLGRDVVKRIGETLEFPGLIRVTVIRETRAVDYAR
jgi:ribonuclease Y